jgi:high-affinity Fe2+/Pb2+ permease
MGRLKENNVNKVSTRYTEYAVASSLSRNVSKSVFHVSFVARLGVHCDAVR